MPNARECGSQGITLVSLINGRPLARFFFCLIYLHIHLWRVGDTVSQTRSERQQKVVPYTFIVGTCSSDLCAKFCYKHLPCCDCLSWLFWGVQGKNSCSIIVPLSDYWLLSVLFVGLSWTLPGRTSLAPLMLQVGRARPDSISNVFGWYSGFLLGHFLNSNLPSALEDEFLAKNSSAGAEGEIKIQNFRSPQKTVSLKLMQWNK